MQHEESKIQCDIVQYLQLRGIFFFSVPNEIAGGGRGKTAMIRTARAKSMGLRSGVSDLIIVLPSKILFMEVKTNTGRQSENQKYFQKKVTELGFEYFIVKSVEDVKKILDMNVRVV
jgi:hypothetical protein